MIFTLEDFLVRLHTGQWFRLEGDRVYENLVILSADPKPTEQECSDGVALLQAEYDSQEYARLRKAEYDQLNQFEMQFDDQRDDTTTWVDAINDIKDRFPK